MMGFKRNIPLTTYVSDEERIQIRDWAKKMGVKVSTYLRIKALEGGKK